MYICNMKDLWPLGTMAKTLKFFKSRSNVKVKVTRSKILVPTERSCDKECTYVIRKPYPFWLGSMAKVKAFLTVGQTSRSRLQGQKFHGTNRKVLSQGMFIWNTKALPLLVRKLWPRLKFFKSWSNLKVKVTRSKILVPVETSCHKECTYEIRKPYRFLHW